MPLARTIDAWTIAVHPNKVIGDKLDAGPPACPADAGTQRGAIFRAAEIGQAASSTSAAAPRRRWSRRSTRSASRASRSSASPTGSIRRPASPRTCSASPTSTAMASPAWSARSTRSCPIRRRAAQPLALSIDSRVQQALEHELGDAMTHFSAIGAAGVVMDVHTGEVLAHDLAAGAQSQRRRAGHAGRAVQPRDARRLRARLDLQAVHRRDGDGQRRHQDLRPDATIAPTRFPLTAISSTTRTRSAAPCSVAEIMMESSNIGTAQIADQARRTRGRRRALKKLGFLDRSQIELRERGRALTPGVALGPVRDDDRRLRPRHRGRAAAARDGLCDLVQRRRLSSADAAQGRPRPPAAGRATASSREETSYKMRALLRLVVMKGTGRKADAPGYRVGGKTGTGEKLINGHYSQTINVTSFAGVFPMDEPRYVIVVMLDEPKATNGDLRLHDRRLERRAGGQRHGQPHRADARRSAGHEPRAGHEPCPALRARSQSGREEGLTGLKLRDLADVDSDSEVTGFAIDHRKVAAGTVFGAFRGAVFNGEDFIGAAVERGAVAVVARPEAPRRRCRCSPTPSRGGCSPSSPPNSSRPSRRRSSPSPAPTARPRPSR